MTLKYEKPWSVVKKYRHCRAKGNS